MASHSSSANLVPAETDRIRWDEGVAVQLIRNLVRRAVAPHASPKDPANFPRPPAEVNASLSIV
jgi:hypothetical protein